MKSISKELYISLFIIASVSSIVAFFALKFSGKEDDILIGLSVIALSSVRFIVLLLLIYKMWSSIQDVYARTTPGKAVGFLFIPIYNLYWLHQMLIGFVEDYNSFISRNDIKIPELQSKYFVMFYFIYIGIFVPIAGNLAYIGTIIVGPMMISEICDAVNSVNFSLSERSRALPRRGAL